MTTFTHAPTQNRARAALGRRAFAGLIGGIAGGVMFGALMATIGMLPIIVSTVRSASP